VRLLHLPSLPFVNSSSTSRRLQVPSIRPHAVPLLLGAAEFPGHPARRCPATPSYKSIIARVLRVNS
jgi:hypothetical protein